MTPPVTPPGGVPALLPAPDLDRLRDALIAADYTVDGVSARLGPVGEAALERGDLAGVRRALAGDDAPAVLGRLFLTGADAGARETAAAFGALDLDAAGAAGLLHRDGDHVRAGVDLRPHDSDLAPGPWWVVSDLGSNVRPGPVAAEHVLGVGPAAVSLAGVTVRRPVGAALDVGTGSGVQALHLAAHADRVVATDVSARALTMAATSWRLSHPGRALDLRRGSLLAPVAGERFGQVVANPPFVVSPAGSSGFTYRDGGLPADDLCRTLVTGMADVLAPGGTAQLLANWVVTAEQPWAERVASWVRGCDAWIWQREIADLGEYAALWLRDAGDGPERPGYAARYDAWVDGLRALGAVAIGMGSVHLRRTASAPVVVAEDVPQPLVPPLGEAVAGWFDRSDRLARLGDAGLLAARLAPAPDLELVRTAGPGPEGWRDGPVALRVRSGMAWEVASDEPTVAVVGGCDGTRPLALLLDLLAATRDDVGEPADLVRRALPVVRDLVRRGLLLPAP